MSALATAFRAELAAVLGDKQVRMIVLLALILYAVIYPLPYRAELLRDVPVVLVDQDGSTASADLARRVDASEAVALTHHAPDMAEATRLVHERRAYGVMLIPDGFERAL
ncbi:ABC transporter permease, partial [Falsiroseomonas sp.]